MVLLRSKVETSKSTSSTGRKRKTKKADKMEEIASKNFVSNPSTSKVYQKLIQSCKYFFVKNPILVVSRLELIAQDEKEEWETSTDGKAANLSRHKLWIADEVGIYNDCYESEKEHNFLSSLIPKIYRCDATKLNLYEQNLSFKEFIFLASHAEEIILGGSSMRLHDGPIPTIKNDDGTVVTLEKLFAALPKVKKLDANFTTDGIITSNTVKELLKIPHFANLNILKLISRNECFDIESFYDYIKKNMKTRIILYFLGVNSLEYKNRLQKIVDEILQTKIHDFKIPYINFIGIENASDCDLRNLY